jgi:hypothetical protein
MFCCSLGMKHEFELSSLFNLKLFKEPLYAGF